MDNLPNYYCAGSHLSLQLPNGVASVTVVRPFTPFTICQVLLVRMDNVPTVVKIYDPRFLNHRGRSKRRPARPWSFALEAEAVRRSTPDPLVEFPPHPDVHDRVGWEMWYYRQMERAFLSEEESYKRLLDLQGHGVPRCFGSGRLILPDRAFFPHVVLLEYIPDAVNLKDITVRPRSSIIASLTKTVSSFGALGVTHNDLNLGNILFTPSDDPTRVVVIDFGESALRKDEPDDEWSSIVESNYDVGYLERRLAWKGWKDGS